MKRIALILLLLFSGCEESNWRRVTMKIVKVAPETGGYRGVGDRTYVRILNTGTPKRFDGILGVEGETITCDVLRRKAKNCRAND